MIHSDNQVRTRIAHLKGALDERREKARVWNQLDELIGSADGSKFRRFAQSLTFNQLIRLANRHLADLHPRYELQRAPGGDLVLQVIDHNMADEVRGVHNLSGGERFLVSLALALAPRAARPHDIEDAVYDLAHRPLPRPARRAGLRQVRSDHAPLCVGKIGLVSGDGAAMLLSSGRRPHGESKVGSRNPLESLQAP